MDAIGAKGAPHLYQTTPHSIRGVLNLVAATLTLASWGEGWKATFQGCWNSMGGGQEPAP